MSPDNVFYANVFLGIFLFGLVFTVVSVMLGASHMGAAGHDAGMADAGGQQVDLGDVGHAGHIGDLGHIGDVGHAGDIGDMGGIGHVGDVGHAGDLGHIGDIGHADTSGAHAGHIGALAHVGAHHADVQVGSHDAELADGLSPLNMPTIMAFLTWFGGAGYIVTRALNIGPLVSVPLALLSGLTGGTIMFVLLARVLWPMRSKPMRSADFSLPGTPARVVSSIRAGGVGEIVYTKSGTRFTAGARSADEQAIARGAQVVILKYEHGMAYVQSVDTLLEQT